MVDGEGLPALIGRFYKAADDAAAWPDALAATCRLLKADSGVLFTLDMTRNEVAFVALARTAPAIMETVKRHYRPLDVFSRVYSSAPVHPVTSRYQFQVEGKPLVWHALGETLARDPASVAVVEFHRHSAETPFEDDARRGFDSLGPHFRQAVHLHRRIAGLAGQRDAAGRVLDRLPIGVIMLDVRGRALLVNRAARAIIAEGNGLSIDAAGVVRATGHDDAQKLNHLIADAIQPRNTPPNLTQNLQDRAMAVSRTSSDTPLSLLLVPLPQERSGNGARRPAAILFVSDPDLLQPAPRSVLSDLYGLTSTEAQVLEILTQGRRPEDVAVEFGVSINTVRTHLKNIYRKTETQGQPELMRLVLTGPAPLALGNGA